MAELAWLPDPAADFIAACRRLVTHPENAGARLRTLATAALDENQLLKIAGVIGKLREAGHSLEPLTPFKLGVIGNGTSDFVLPALAGTAARYGVALECIAGGFDQSLQDALDPGSNIHLAAPDAILVALDWRGVPLRSRFGHASTEPVDAVIQHLRKIRAGTKANGNAVCIFQNFAPPAERFFGSFDRALPGSPRHILDEINRALAEMVRSDGDVLLDVAGIAENAGLSNWHSPGEWNLAKLPFSQAYLNLYAEHVCRLIAALRGKSRRCLVLDLDNTLWGGVVGDDGLQGIRIAQGDPEGEAFLSFQRYALSLRERGIVLAVSSKNTDEVARAPFREHPEMLLREEHFAVFQANWNDKPTNIQAIANELSLGLESFVFVDDNPFERELVRKTLPQVAVPEMPADPALYARTLSDAGYFEAVAYSSEDAMRATYYEGNARRAELQKQVGDLNAYLASLEMEIWLRPFDPIGRARISQLINKSNQFNLTTRRYSEMDIEELESDSRCFTLQARLKDALGDNGMISVVVCRPSASVPDTEWEIDTWLMSCRVLGRRVENAVLAEILSQASRRGIQRLKGVYLPTGRNKLVEDHYANLGFEFTGNCPDGGSTWLMQVAGAQVTAAPMIVHSEGFQPSPVMLSTLP